MKVTLNFTRIPTPEAAHEYLKNALALPEYYGKNLDALYDVLSTWDRPMAFSLRLPDSGDMGAWCSRMQRVFADAAQANSRIRLVK